MEEYKWTWTLWILLLLSITAIIFLLRFYRTKQGLFKKRKKQVFSTTGNQSKISLHKNNKFIPKLNIKIRKHNNLQKKEILPEEFLHHINKELYYTFDLNHLWPDTILKKIYMTENLYHKIDVFFDQHRDKHPERILDKEIGGFLLGRFTRKSSEEPYEVSIENFVAIGSAEDHHLHLEFNSNDINSKLGDAQDEFPELVVVGWFHTHPGHGLFLSKADLKIQRGFFDEHFQFAMEIDSLSNQQDLGFFTHRTNGDINNSPPKSSWFSWNKIKSEL